MRFATRTTKLSRILMALCIGGAALFLYDALVIIYTNIAAKHVFIDYLKDFMLLIEAYDVLWVLIFGLIILRTLTKDIQDDLNALYKTKD